MTDPLSEIRAREAAATELRRLHRSAVVTGIVRGELQQVGAEQDVLDHAQENHDKAEAEFYVALSNLLAEIDRLRAEVEVAREKALLAARGHAEHFRCHVDETPIGVSIRAVIDGIVNCIDIERGIAPPALRTLAPRLADDGGGK